MYIYFEYNILCIDFIVLYAMLIYFNVQLIKTIIFILIILLASSYLSLLERHSVAVVQQRVGPTTAMLGFIQPLADAFKLLTKEPTYPYRSNVFFFLFAPLYTASVALLFWGFIPLSNEYSYTLFKFNLILILALFTLNNYGIILGS